MPSGPDVGDTVEQWVARYEEAAETSRQIAATMELDRPCTRADLIDSNLRWVLLHLIAETARHVGHADIIRETLDGSRGEATLGGRPLVATRVRSAAPDSGASGQNVRRAFQAA